ncbi:craniofacial development protein 2 [Plakobranchus ocellatus]|uniref:Craniofacial development protein 2 n=1 Tax=Plakobranchus ocellatus TaxID=259542 RepID=A0AAV3ZGQ0_9GAST|nr:craniofacial development protein 2 [Plakobranchus ocellatus]
MENFGQIVCATNKFRLRQCTKQKKGKVTNDHKPICPNLSSKNNPDELDKFYNDLQTLIDSLPNNTLIIFAGDFNSKVGKRSGEESCLGNYSRGFRNENGENLVDFCEKNKLFITTQHSTKQPDTSRPGSALARTTKTKLCTFTTK